MTITLPDEMRDELERKAHAAGFASVAEYVADLIIADETPIAVPQPPPEARYSVQTREELEAKLLEGMNREGDVVADADFWQRRRQALDARTKSGSPK
jgi:hypothetical protein